ncbi:MULTISPECIES: 3-isopropylmalate dehydratase small subunit [Streptomyces]|uniref:3-isopropylmalate dehydratase small subunit n=1 Tax=Streptomyces TaxID=1883 RepID=UPI000CD54B5F|nr:MULTISPECIES: 3-isopropylmalate dehydratase small subunit [Streptomyces]MCX4712990.1 3-isopropylmalate dehydratase small subunit [Streptomyces griseus]QXR00619.1 3-isopropylmalate dehydratase small subunit [Streptomyces sp. WY228]
MEPLTEHTGSCLPLRRSDVDTDQIIPARHCRSLTKSGYAEALFGHWRKDPGFVLNRPEHQGASILLAGPHFGTGSSREHAVWALRDWGVRAVIAASFGDIFQRNALRNGVLAVRLPDAVVDGLLDRAELDPAVTLTVDLRGQEVRADGKRWPFEVDARARRLLLEGLDDIEVALRAQDAIARHEQNRPDWMPRPSAAVRRC